MNWFSRFRKRVKDEAQLEIVLARLEFLAKEFEFGRDRKVDVWHWKEQLDELADLHLKHDVALYSAQEAYRILFGVVARKYGYSENLTIDEFTAGLKESETESVDHEAI